MGVVFALTLGLLALAALLVLYRLARGPGVLDRVVAVDVLVVLLVAGVAVGIAAGRDEANIQPLIAVALLGFVSSVTVARLLEGRRRS